MALAICTQAILKNVSGDAYIAPLSLIEVRKESDSTLATIYSDVNGASQINNPTNADAEGMVSFYAAGIARGYKITITNSAGTRVLRNVAIGTAAEFDISDVVGGTLNAASLAAFLVAIGGVSQSALDTAIASLDSKPSVLCATTANITLSGEQTLDGILTSASRVLVKNQTAPAQNGIYLSAAGAWTRVADMDTWAEVPGAIVIVERGTVAAEQVWICTADQGGTLNTTAITWSQFAAGVPVAEPQVDVFTAGGTWTKRTGATDVTVILVGSGGGGGSGRRGAAGTARGGGIGGSAGQAVFAKLPASILGATETVTVGAGAAGGASRVVDNTDGAPGVAGNISSFGAWVRSIADGAAEGGTNTSTTGHPNPPGYPASTYGAPGDVGTTDPTSGAVNDPPDPFGMFPGGGGGGGSLTSANVATNGTNGGRGSLNGQLVAKGAAGVVAGASPTAGTAVTTNNPQGGGGGGGGAASVAGAGQAGAAGGLYGGGGGGGGASVNGQASGAGGAGGGGIVVVIQT